MPDRLLQIAKALIAERQHQRAWFLLHSIRDLFPDTEVAAEAKVLMGHLPEPRLDSPMTDSSASVKTVAARHFGALPITKPPSLIS